VVVATESDLQQYGNNFSLVYYTPPYVRVEPSMPLDPPAPGSPEDWLRHARSDLALAQQRQVPEVLLAALCFHAQQAVEKSLKAVLLKRGVAFPYTHDLARIITLVKSGGLPWLEELDAAAALTVYAAGSR